MGTIKICCVKQPRPGAFSLLEISNVFSGPRRGVWRLWRKGSDLLFLGPGVPLQFLQFFNLDAKHYWARLSM